METTIAPRKIFVGANCIEVENLVEMKSPWGLTKQTQVLFGTKPRSEEKGLKLRTRGRRANKPAPFDKEVV
jgi:hypothetical protein